MIVRGELQIWDNESGRIERQGNENSKVHIYTYVTEGTFDIYSYQLVERKQKIASQIMSSKMPMREMEDIDSRALNYGEIKAIATGDSRIVEKNELEQQVSKLKLLKQNYLNEQYNLQDKIAKQYPQEIKKLEDTISEMEKDLENLQKYKLSEDGFSTMKIQDKIFIDKKAAGTYLLECLKNIKDISAETHIGEYRGFNIFLGFSSFDKNFYLRLKNNSSYRVELGSDVFGNITRINNLIENIPTNISNIKQQLDNLQIQFENSKLELKKPFEKQEELDTKQKRLIQINKELKLDEKEKDLFDESQEQEEIVTEKERDEVEL